MPAELTESTTRPRISWGRVLRDVLLVLVIAAVAGAVCGVLWEMWWTPPSGLVLEGVWYPDAEGVRQLFSGTGLYVVIAVAGGVLVGASCAWLFDRVELATLTAVAFGSVLAAWLMLQVGTSLAPEDPTALAAESVDYTELPGALAVEGDGAYVAFPVGALTGVTIVFIGLTPTRRIRD